MQGGLNIGMRPTESVNGLIGVADAEEPMPVSGHQRPHKGNLQRRKVLYFVDQHVGPLAFRFGLQAGQPVLQQIRIVRKVPLALGGVVTLLQGGLFVRQGVEALPGEGQLIPYASGVGGGQGVGLGEHAPGRFFGQHGWQGLLSGAPMG